MRQIVGQVEDAFSSGGLLSRVIDGFSARESQQNMAKQVAQVIENRQSLVVEAGTGTGKTFAYLVPALLSGCRVLVSTATKTLQDQLFDKDIPKIRQALEKPVQVALLKGRQNYVCHYHLNRALLEARLPLKQDVAYLQTIKTFSMATNTGDKADCTGVPETSAVWSHVTSHRDNCLGGECPNARECFVNKARKEALDADVVVINHHLFMADLALKEEGVAELLPASDVVIFDEAHQLPEIASNLLGQNISTGQLQEFLRDVLIEGRSTSADAGNWDDVITPLELLIKDIRRVVGAEIEAARMNQAQFMALGNAAALCLQFGQGMARLVDFLEPLAPRSESWLKLTNRAVELTTQWQSWFAQTSSSQASLSVSKSADAYSVRWVNVLAHSVQFCDSPLDVSDAFAKLYAAQSKAWIFASATLSVKDSLVHFKASMGLDAAVDLLLPSPFDYEANALLCVPENLPMPNAPQFSFNLCEAVWPALKASDGGVFFLCTSLKAVELVGRYIADRVDRESLGWQVLTQGDASRAELLTRFRSVEKPVLVGAASFWEGVDIRGEQLRLVVIDRLPFAPPDDPVFQAKSEWVKSKGGNSFADLSIPDATIALKQGAGRLIRDETDKGVLIIGDRRLVEKGYGKLLWRSLPPFRRTRDINVAVDFLQSMRHFMGTEFNALTPSS